MIALIPVRDGLLPNGGAETVAECGGRAVLVGRGTLTAAGELAGIASEISVWEAGDYAPAAWSRALAPVLAVENVVVLPGSPDGRDLAPRLAHAMGRPLLAGAIRVHPRGADLARWGGLVIEEGATTQPFVATLQPGVRGVEPDAAIAVPESNDLSALLTPTVLDESERSGGPDATIVEVLPPDVATMDLAEAPRIVGGGAGLDGEARFEQLSRIGHALGASMGATRVVTDRHWVSHERQIGTTGVVVDPRLYLAFGISGAVQHTSGLGQPDHIVSVNVEPHCPMMQMADLAIVGDANATLDELERRLLG